MINDQSDMHFVTETISIVSDKKITRIWIDIQFNTMVRLYYLSRLVGISFLDLELEREMRNMSYSVDDIICH